MRSKNTAPLTNAERQAQYRQIRDRAYALVRNQARQAGYPTDPEGVKEFMLKQERALLYDALVAEGHDVYESGLDLESYAESIGFTLKGYQDAQDALASLAVSLAAQRPSNVLDANDG